MSGWLIQTDRGIFFFEIMEDDRDLGKFGLPLLYDNLGRIPIIYGITYISDLDEEFASRCIIL